MFGSVFARCVAEKGKKVLIVDQRSHIGGNCYTEKIEGISVHKYGPHSFHTNNKKVWDFVNRFAEFNNYQSHIKVNYKGALYSFPINMMTLHQLWGVNTPEEAVARIKEEKIPIENPANLEEWVLSEVGREIYDIFIKGYTTKQWGRKPSLLPSFIIKRLPIRLTFDDRYFDDRYQGIPVGGYTKMFENILDHNNISISLNTNYFDSKNELDKIATTTVYSGKIDEYFDYKFGELEYRSLKFKSKVLDGDFQGNAIINYTDEKVRHTRIIEHKHFEFQQNPKTVVTWERPDSYDRKKIPFYPIQDEKNKQLYREYEQEAKITNVIFGGRLGTYSYYDMHQVIAQAMKKGDSACG